VQTDLQADVLGSLASEAVRSGPGSIVNAMTIDVEDYFQVSAFEDRVCRTEWHTFESRVCRNTERLLEIFYLHPWEIDPEQPRIASSGLTQVRHYRNVAKTEARLRRMLSEFSFGRVSDVLQLTEAGAGGLL
jgi:hypothetical protein